LKKNKVKGSKLKERDKLPPSACTSVTNVGKKKRDGTFL